LDDLGRNPSGVMTVPNNSRGAEERKETEELTPEENMEIETERVYYKFMSKDGFTMY